MSSFIGHSIPAIGLYLSRQSSQQLVALYPRQRWFWLLWLVLVAWAPDIDHFVPALHASAHQGLRVTHSFVFCLLLPGCTILGLKLLQLKRQELRFCSAQLLLAALSHLLLDMLTGAMKLPLFYPLSQQTFRLPFGLLPSAGSINITNYFFYRNLLIELGVLLPLLGWVYWESHGFPLNVRSKSAIALLLGCSFGFTLWAVSLSR
jgi:inner membrane protein